MILVQFDAGGQLAPHVRIHLERLKHIAKRLILVSNSPISDQGLAAANALCDKVVLRANVGLDFAGWRDALADETMAEWDTIILTNSSIVGPLYPLAPIIDKMEASSADFWGLVHSMQTGSHLQSYFLGFSGSVIQSNAWAEFWRDVEDLEDKWEIIKRYEVGLTQHLVASGFTFSALMRNPSFPFSIKMVSVDRLGGRIKVPFDINRVGRTLREHRELIEEGMPYLKASLLWGIDTHRCEPIERIKAIEGVEYPWEEIGF